MSDKVEVVFSTRLVELLTQQSLTPQEHWEGMVLLKEFLKRIEHDTLTRLSAIADEGE